MGKRSDFKRRKNDAYFTPYEPVEFLVPFLPKEQFTYVEPCAGDGRLTEHLQRATDDRAICIGAYDINPKAHFVQYGDTCQDGIQQAIRSTHVFNHKPNFYITNPPWTRKLLHEYIKIYSKRAPTWLLFDASWAHTQQAVPYLKLCTDIVSVGRVRWIADSDSKGYDDAAWYKFDLSRKHEGVMFHRLDPVICEEQRKREKLRKVKLKLDRKRAA